MAKARMLHKKISLSLEVNNLALPARLLYTWMISHADDDGRIKGDPKYIKATVTPLTNWSIKRIKQYLEDMAHQGLIHYWKQNGQWSIEFVKWTDFQSIPKDRYKVSELPSFSDEFVNSSLTNDTQDVFNLLSQSNINELKSNETNEIKASTIERRSINASDSFKKDRTTTNPVKFIPASKGETAALDAWKKLEPNNLFAFRLTYLKALDRGLPINLFYEFSEELSRDKTIKNPGAVFNKKVEEYFNKR